jgi:hypothetical protein
MSPRGDLRKALLLTYRDSEGLSLGCSHFDPNDARRQVWTGKWPGEEDCERLDFFVNGDSDFPDLNRLFTECVWDADTQRWERKQ